MLKYTQPINKSLKQTEDEPQGTRLEAEFRYKPAANNFRGYSTEFSVGNINFPTKVLCLKDSSCLLTIGSGIIRNLKPILLMLVNSSLYRGSDAVHWC